MIVPNECIQAKPERGFIMAEQLQGPNGSAESILEQVKNAIREAVRGGMRPTVRRLGSVEQRVAELEGDKPRQQGADLRPVT